MILIWYKAKLNVGQDGMLDKPIDRNLQYDIKKYDVI